MILHRTDIASRASVTICFVDVESYADCSVWETDNEVWADGPLKWCWTEYESRADTIVHVVDNPAWADVKVYRTPNEAWVRGSFPG